MKGRREVREDVVAKLASQLVPDSVRAERVTSLLHAEELPDILTLRDALFAAVDGAAVSSTSADANIGPTKDPDVEQEDPHFKAIRDVVRQHSIFDPRGGAMMLSLCRAYERHVKRITCQLTLQPDAMEVYCHALADATRDAATHEQRAQRLSREVETLQAALRECESRNLELQQSAEALNSQVVSASQKLGATTEALRRAQHLVSVDVAKVDRALLNHSLPLTPNLTLLQLVSYWETKDQERAREVSKLQRQLMAAQSTIESLKLQLESASKGGRT